MAKSERGRRDRDDDEEADEGSAGPGRWSRQKEAMRLRIAQRLDRAIALIQRQRLRLVPEEAEEAGKKQGKQTDQAIQAPEVRRGMLMRFLIGVLLLLIGTIAGVVFSFNLFAQKVESQADFIANQADAVFAYDKEARRAERALEKSRTELKEALQQLEETVAELHQTKTRLAEIEGRGLLYGGKGDSNVPPAADSHAAASPSQQQMLEKICKLESISASFDLSKCLDRGRR